MKVVMFQDWHRRPKMATKKTAETKQAGRKGTTKRNAGKAAKAPRVTAKTMAADIARRENRRPGFWDDIRRELAALQKADGASSSAAQVMPRENGAEATH